MKLRIFPIVGEALNLGARRMETVARVAWLPLVLLLIANMVAIFAYLSVIAGRLVTFADIPTYARAQITVSQFASKGFSESPAEMWLITAISIFISWLLVSSYMAPLIRYAGLGIKPRPGVIRLPFGASQLRFLVASILSFVVTAFLMFVPIAVAGFYTLKYVANALAQTVASFPDATSLHTIEITTAGKTMAAEGSDWIYNHVIPLAGVAPLIFLLWMILFFHFHPRNRNTDAEGGNFIARLVVTFLVTIVSMIGAYFLLAETVIQQFRSDAIFLASFASFVEQANALHASLSLDFTTLKEAVMFLIKSPVNRLLFFGVASFFLMNYVSIRLMPYVGIAVCRGSLGPGGTLRVSRGWNILRLAVIVGFVGGVLLLVQAVFINGILLKSFLPAIAALLYEATAVSTKLVNSGEVASWVLPTFVWIWNITKILINLVWTIFSVSVWATLYGRLYRESEVAQ
ncbi:hypothetical protein ABFZ85_01465 [Hyphococcus formosus]|uniref:hypothetical protein n=1 Tax=Hyphococcus formosus TaxID=3143534 RepID=UPI00398B69FC